MQAADPDPLDDCDAIACYGSAKATDNHLASTVHCVDDEIIGRLKRPEQCGRDRHATKQPASSREPAQSVIGIAASSLRHSMRTEQMQPLLREIGQLRQLIYDPSCEMAHRQEPLSLVLVSGLRRVGGGARNAISKAVAS
jgi:hypothetical protein